MASKASGGLSGMSEIAMTELLRPPTFGYHPDFERIETAFDLGDFPRAVILDTAVRAIADNVEQCRVSPRPPTYEKHSGPEIQWISGPEFVAGTGFEPATSGL